MAIPSRTESGQGVLGIEWPARFSSSGLVTLAPLMLHGGPASDTEVPATLGPRPLIARRGSAAVLADSSTTGQTGHVRATNQAI